MPKKSSGSAPKSKRRYPREYAARRFRQHRLHDLLSAGETVTLERLHDEFGVSVRTIKDDIQRMREDDGAPIKWEQRLLGYVYSGPYAGPPLLRITDDEALALAMSARRFGAVPGSPLARAFLTVLKKVAPLVGGDASFAFDALRDVLVVPDHHAAREDRFIPMLHEASRRHCEVIVNYQRPTLEPSERTVRPLCVAYIDHCWMLIGRDVRKPAEDRLYLLARMVAVTPTTTRFTPPPDFDAEKLRRGDVRRFLGQGNHEVRVAYDAIGAAYAREKLAPHLHKFRKLPDGREELTRHVNNFFEIEKEVLKAGEHAEVMHPPELRERFRAIARALLKRYEAA